MGAVTTPPPKVRMRRRMRDRLDAIRPAERERMDAAIRQHLRARLPRRGDILGYMALPDEVDLGGLLEELARADRLLLPRVEGDGLHLHRVANLSADLEPGAWGIREPRRSLPIVEDPTPVCALVPGRAFDRKGGRLGRGGGFYDRLLPTLAHTARFLGVSRSVQIVDAVPSEPHDVRMNGVMTEQGLIDIDLETEA